MENVNKVLDDFLSKTKRTQISDTDQEVCDMETGECYVLRTKDGIVERINKRYVTEDGRQLLND